MIVIRKEKNIFLEKHIFHDFKLSVEPRPDPHDQCAILVLTTEEINIELEFIVLRETEDGTAKSARAYFIQHLPSS